LYQGAVIRNDLLKPFEIRNEKVVVGHPVRALVVHKILTEAARIFRVLPKPQGRPELVLRQKLRREALGDAGLISPEPVLADARAVFRPFDGAPPERRDNEGPPSALVRQLVFHRRGIRTTEPVRTGLSGRAVVARQEFFKRAAFAGEPCGALGAPRPARPAELKRAFEGDVAHGYAGTLAARAAVPAVPAGSASAGRDGRELVRDAFFPGRASAALPALPAGAATPAFGDEVRLPHARGEQRDRRSRSACRPVLAVLAGTSILDRCTELPTFSGLARHPILSRRAGGVDRAAIAVISVCDKHKREALEPKHIVLCVRDAAGRQEQRTAPR
jgi:hypothetical protein